MQAVFAAHEMRLVVAADQGLPDDVAVRVGCYQLVVCVDHP